MLPSFSQFCDYHYSKSLLQFITVDAHRETDVKIHFVEYDEFNQQDQDPAAAASVAASKLRHEPLVLGFGKRPTGSIHEQLHELVWRAGLRLRCIISLSYAICSEQSTTREGNHCARSNSKILGVCGHLCIKNREDSQGPASLLVCALRCLPRLGSAQSWVCVNDASSHEEPPNIHARSHEARMRDVWDRVDLPSGSMEPDFTC
jgi:hypothetical protein